MTKSFDLIVTIVKIHVVFVLLHLVYIYKLMVPFDFFLNRSIDKVTYMGASLS